MNVKARLTALKLMEKQKTMPHQFERLGVMLEMITKDKRPNREEKENVQLCGY